MVHEIVVGALLRGSRVLLVHRSPDRRDFPARWSLPGGHVEPGEPPVDALVRELREELGVEAVVSGAPSLHLERRPDADDGMVQDAWVVTDWDGAATNKAEEEHDELRWVTAEELPHLDLAHPEHLPFLRDLLAR
jgi:8-oxo-dGTP diphosphatase